jgi:Protein of unknown function (DUF2849).
MAKKLTANRLIDGTVLYWKGGAWTETFAEADRFEREEEGVSALALARASVVRNEVVNPYFVELKGDAPLKEREIIRAQGPSVRTDLGKQAEGLSPLPEAFRASPQGGGKEVDDVSI